MPVRLAAAPLLALLAATATARADTPPPPFLAGIHHFETLGSTVPGNGDQNPYAVVVAPASSGTVRKDDVLVTNFNDRHNLQGLGTTIVDYRPSTGNITTFARLDRHLAACPGGIGLTTAMTMLRNGTVIVGSLPSNDGTTATKGTGCLVALRSDGTLLGTLTGPGINGPWGNMAVIDHGTTATLFVSDTGIGVGAPGQDVVRKANVLRIELATPPDALPRITKETVIADGFGEQADKDVFIVGPTGLALGANGTLYVSDAIGNRIAAIPDASTRTTSAGTGRTVTSDGMLRRPLALALAPNGDLLAANALEGTVVEIDPRTGQQLRSVWIDANRAQTPPGSGDLFGLAVTPDGHGLYYVKDDLNTLVLGR